jgi:hypothetical protein
VKPVLPADPAERQRILEAVDSEEQRNHMYTAQTLGEIKSLLMAAESAHWSNSFAQIYKTETYVRKEDKKYPIVMTTCSFQ